MEFTRARAEVAQRTGSASHRAAQTAEYRLPGREHRPGKVIALLNQKGGAGKTTLATHLAGELALAGSRVTLLDADPQGSALDWAQRRLQNGQERLYGVFGLARDSLHQEAPQTAVDADYVVIDGPPRVAALGVCAAEGFQNDHPNFDLSEPRRSDFLEGAKESTTPEITTFGGVGLLPRRLLARSALLAADLVLIPLQPSAYDVWASHEMVTLIAEARVFRPQLRAAFVINRRVVGTVIGREARAALADQPFAALNAEVSQRIVFADSVAAGRLACEAAPNCAAAREIAALAQAVREMLR